MLVLLFLLVTPQARQISDAIEVTIEEVEHIEVVPPVLKEIEEVETEDPTEDIPSTPTPEFPARLPLKCRLIPTTWRWRTSATTCRRRLTT
jgi:hypothetical protein